MKKVIAPYDLMAKARYFLYILQTEDPTVRKLIVSYERERGDTTTIILNSSKLRATKRKMQKKRLNE